MVIALTVTNYKGESIRIPLDDPSESGFIIKEISGIGAPKADVMTIDYIALDGSYVNSVRVQKRTISINLLEFNRR